MSHLPLRRRRLLAASALLPSLAAPALAQEAPWPSRPIRIVVPYPPGGGSDVTARLVATGIQAALGQSVVIDNRAGASGVIGTEAVARSAPDGYTLLLADLPHTAVPHLMPNLPFDPVADFASVSLVGVAPMILFANPRLPARDARAFAELARARPDGFSIALAGIGGNTHLMSEMFQRVTGTKLVQVPYRGSGPSITDLAAGQVQVAFTTMLTAAPFLQNNTIRALGVATAERMPELPDTPTFREQGIDLVAAHWWGLLAPAGTPAPIVERVAAALAGAVQEPTIRARMATMGLVPQATGPAAFASLIRSDLARWGELVRAAQIRIE
ncbi:tripartite tricarboxylate transporter substrate binding protein [Roseococcus sp. SYP-B2431]|uniref:tripartite tricarboxylate transporter substrate binding protein n=1 Tax=Roseococcus sp. SYP-B2431 TaxID=2496640 RepID=UPI0013F45AB6|nr:tripartite tricarboxylate transporter substrate binding protein [Roseococcus sp. SYP-B2431]